MRKWRPRFKDWILEYVCLIFLSKVKSCCFCKNLDLVWSELLFRLIHVSPTTSDQQQHDTTGILGGDLTILWTRTSGCWERLLRWTYAVQSTANLVTATARNFPQREGRQISTRDVLCFPEYPTGIHAHHPLRWWSYQLWRLGCDWQIS